MSTNLSIQQHLSRTMSDLTTFPSPAAELKVLILGAGGREHALSYKLAQSSRVANIFVCPGNGGTALMGGKVENLLVPWGGAAGYGDVVNWAVGRGVDLVVPGPEQPLVDGVETLFKKGLSSHSTVRLVKGLPEI